MTTLTPNFSPVSPTDSRDRVCSIHVIDNLPPSVDLKPDVFEVENQGQIGSCTANAGCSALEMLYNRNKTPVDLSRLFLYYYTRKLGGLKGDVGAYPRDIGKALKAYGTCLEETWKYDGTLVDTEPSAPAKTEANSFKISSYEQIVGSTRLDQVKSLLSQGIPVLLSITVHNGFFSLTGNWKSHTWDWKTSLTNPVKGGHEMLIIGYDDNAQRFLVENSWGAGWGDGGFCGIPYSIMDSDAFGELWVVIPNLDIPYTPPPFFDRIKSLIAKHNSKMFIGAGLLCAVLMIFSK